MTLLSLTKADRKAEELLSDGFPQSEKSRKILTFHFMAKKELHVLPECVGLTCSSKKRNKNMIRWDWREYYSNDDAIARFECTGFSFEEKGQNQTFHLSDIPSEARRSLADKLRLNESNFEEWAELDKVDTCLENYCFVVAVRTAWYKSTSENWDWERTGGDDRETAEYSCPGWSCSKEILNKILDNRLTFHDIPLNARENLAQKVGLDEREIDKWGQELQGWIDRNGIRVTVRVPNVWITANILAFEPSFTGFFAAVGGIIGAAGTSVSNAFSGMMEVKCSNFTDLLSKLDVYKGKIRGFTLYAHGGENGAITAVTESRIVNWQEDLIHAVWQNNYKLAEINLRQCFSGFEGETIRYEKLQKNESISAMEQQLKQKFLAYPFIHVDDIKVRPSNDTFSAEVKITVNWANTWKMLGVNVNTYKGLNVCLIDTYLLTNIFSGK